MVAASANAAANLVSNGSMDFGAPGAPTDWTFLVPTGEFWVSFAGQPSPDGGAYLGVQRVDVARVEQIENIGVARRRRRIPAPR